MSIHLLGSSSSPASNNQVEISRVDYNWFNYGSSRSGIWRYGQGGGNTGNFHRKCRRRRVKDVIAFSIFGCEVLLTTPEMVRLRMICVQIGDRH